MHGGPASSFVRDLASPRQTSARRILATERRDRFPGPGSPAPAASRKTTHPDIFVRVSNTPDKPPAAGSADAEETAPVRTDDTLGALVRKTFLSPVTLALIVLTIPLSVWGVLRTAANANDESLLTGFLLTATATLPTAWAVIRVIWSESATVAIMIALLRTVVVPLVVAWPPAIATTIAVHIPAIRARIEASQTADGWRYFFGERDGSLLGQTLGLGGLVGIIFAILTGLALSVFVVLPALAWFKPLGAAKSNLLLTDTPENRAASTLGIRLLSLVLMLTFAVPTFIIFGKDQATASSLLQAVTRLPRFVIEPQYYYGDLFWVLGVLLIPLGVLAILWLLRVQRPDRAARAKLGVNSPADQRRFEQDQLGANGGAADDDAPPQGD